MIKYSRADKERFLNNLVAAIRKFHKKPCPTNKILAVALGVDSKRVYNGLETLMKTGRIAKIGQQANRNFRCVRTGMQTGAPKLPQPQRTRKDRSGEIGGTRLIKYNPDAPHGWYGPRDDWGRPIRSIWR